MPNSSQEIYFDPEDHTPNFTYPAPAAPPPPPTTTTTTAAVMVTPPASPQSPFQTAIVTGKLNFSDGREFYGYHLNGRLISGVMTYPDGSCYEGSWIDGQREGQGCCDFPDGSRYEGEFHRGYFHGHGQLTWSDGGFYDGDFVRGEMQGNGMEVRGDGTLRHNGLWKQGIPIRQNHDSTRQQRSGTHNTTAHHPMDRMAI